MHMNRRDTLAALAAAAIGTTVRAQTRRFPDKPITVVVPFPAGSGADLQVRVLSTSLSDLLKVPVLVSNLPGGEGAVAFNAIRNAPPDGYTLFRTTSATQVFNGLLLAKPPFDAVADLRPIAGLTRIYQVLLVPARSPSKTVADVIARAKAQPGKLSTASASSGRFSSLMFSSLADVELLHVPYKGIPQALTDLAGGTVDMMFSDVPASLPMIQSGRVRPLGVTSTARLAALADVPTMREAGLHNFDFSAWSGMYAHQATPEDVVKTLHEAIAAANQSAAMTKFLKDGSLERFDLSPAELSQFQRSDIALWKSLAAKMKIKPE